MTNRRGPVFLARDSYRWRRIGDAARFVPLLGVLLLLLPVLWARSNDTASTIVYIFSAWAFLIVLIGLLSRRLSDGVADSEDHASDDGSAER